MQRLIPICLSFFLALAAGAQEQPSHTSGDKSNDKRDDLTGFANSDSLIDRRLLLESFSSENPFVLTPHKPNYIMPLTYNSSPNTDVESELADEYDNVEIKFQLSFKIPLWYEIFSENSRLYFAYTQQSYWQAYNFDVSAPFRETNYEPEFFVTFLTNNSLWGFKSRIISVGFVHQSNGRAEPLSRSWNRIYASFVFEKEHFAFALKPWYRIPEDPEDDNNPDIYRYMGYGELTAIYVDGENEYGMLFRNNLRSDPNRTGIQLDWSRTMHNKLKLYVQYYYGYGESLLDYDDSANRIGIGFMLNNWL